MTPRSHAITLDAKNTHIPNEILLGVLRHGGRATAAQFSILDRMWNAEASGMLRNSLGSRLTLDNPESAFLLFRTILENPDVGNLIVNLDIAFTFHDDFPKNEEAHLNKSSAAEGPVGAAWERVASTTDMEKIGAHARGVLVQHRLLKNKNRGEGGYNYGHSDPEVTRDRKAVACNVFAALFSLLPNLHTLNLVLPTWLSAAPPYVVMGSTKGSQCSWPSVNTLCLRREADYAPLHFINIHGPSNVGILDISAFPNASHVETGMEMTPWSPLDYLPEYPGRFGPHVVPVTLVCKLPLHAASTMTSGVRHLAIRHDKPLEDYEIYGVIKTLFQFATYPRHALLETVEIPHIWLRIVTSAHRQGDPDATAFLTRFPQNQDF